MPPLAELGGLFAGAGVLIATTAKAVVWIKSGSNGNGKAEARVMERTATVLEFVIKNQERQQSMTRDLTALTQQIAGELERHGEREARVWERVAEQLDTITRRQT